MKIKATNELVNIKKLGFDVVNETEKAFLFKGQNPFSFDGQDLINLDNGNESTVSFYPQFWIAKQYVETTKTTIKVPLWTITSNFSLKKERG